MDPSELVEVYKLYDPGRLAVLKLILDREGAPYFIDGENQAGLTGILEIRILAPASHAEAVRNLILSTDRKPDGEPS